LVTDEVQKNQKNQKTGKIGKNQKNQKTGKIGKDSRTFLLKKFRLINELPDST
jgi:hypothetical protein